MATVFFIKWIELQLMFNMSALNEASASLPVSECTCCPHLYYPNLPEDNAVVCCTMSSSGCFFFFECLYSVHSLCICIGLFSVVYFINNSFLKLYIAENVFPYESRAPQLVFILLLRELNCTASHASSDRNSWLVIFISKIDNI